MMKEWYSMEAIVDKFEMRMEQELYTIWDEVAA